MEAFGPRADQPHPLAALAGEVVWYVSAGGCTWPELLLVLGGEVARDAPLRNPRQPVRFRRSRGTHELLVPCAWTLLLHDEPLADASLGRAHARSIRALSGARVLAVDAQDASDGLELRFHDGRRLLLRPGDVPLTSVGVPGWEAWLPCGEVAARPRAPSSPAC